jgi:hypothetical protein
MRRSEILDDAVLDLILLELGDDPGILVRCVLAPAIGGEHLGLVAMKPHPRQELFVALCGVTLGLGEKDARPSRDFTREGDDVLIAKEVRGHFTFQIRPHALERLGLVGQVATLAGNMAPSRLANSAHVAHTARTVGKVHIDCSVLHHLLQEFGVPVSKSSMKQHERGFRPSRLSQITALAPPMRAR